MSIQKIGGTDLNRIRWYPYRFKKFMRRTLRRLKLMKPYEPKDAFYRPFPLDHALSCVGNGWGDLIRECYAICIRTETDIHQVKEKFGGLRFYVGGSTREGLDLIEDICDRSYKICENCGNPGELDTGRGWYKTLCSNCTQVTWDDPSRQLEHLMSPEAWEDWTTKVESGEVARTVLKFIKDLRGALEKENSE